MTTHAGMPAKAPCGHDGQVVIGTYVECLKDGCDGTPDFASEEATPVLVRVAERCPYCGLYDVEEFTGFYFGTVQGMHCNDCGRVWPK